MQRDLVRRTQAGDHDAFAILAGDALERVYGTARLILLDQDRARDAAQDGATSADCMTRMDSIRGCWGS